MSAEAAEVDLDARIRCSDWSRVTSLSPAGTAGTYPGYLLVELPLPWPRDVAEAPEAAALAPLLASTGYRLQAVVPSDPAAAPAERRVILHARPPGQRWFAGYRRFERPVGVSLPEAVADLLAAAAEPGPSRLEAPAIDVLVCGHGTRDSCCGRLGAGLTARLGAVAAPDGVTIWRTSHLGGHRFAATFLLLPEGTSWAYGDVELVETVLRRKGDFDAVAGYYRGCSGVDGPQAQALEGEVARQVGWSLLDSPRTSTFDGSRADLTCVYDGETVTWSAQVGKGRAVSMPDCQSPPSSATKTQSEWAVSAITRDQHLPSPDGGTT
ncbi:sucrase ferredoxin [Pseudofrankia inefficax]|uniref:Sucraseferredoxin family protein n=1 Tax=Pseudofrankia inefficax (strain DSM 45817 / CECT 9037 / DDB 130130 / EuI1c) TaxID=298654 RepID=E3J8A1_PSEI1|nr:sucrase ferredoxin [Pseudofrankia inefficax]ADP83294.1 Sucraseferredoxin family protein [Pseudofrankia inefficax]